MLRFSLLTTLNRELQELSESLLFRLEIGLCNIKKSQKSSRRQGGLINVENSISKNSKKNYIACKKGML